MLTTKEQECKALEKIRKIVEELGESSYIATALDGCLQDAENNIMDDAAYSMKSRFEYSEGQLSKAQEEIQRLKTCIECAKAEKEHWEAEREELRAARLYSSLQDKLVQILEEGISNCDTKCFDIVQQLTEAEPEDFQRLQEKAKKAIVNRANYSNILWQLQAIKCE